MKRLVPGLVSVLALAGCSGEAAPPSASPSASSSPSRSATGEPGVDAAFLPAYDKAFDPGLSEPVEDRVYPEVGDPGVDALHYDLDLAWDPDTSTLEATEVLTFRAAADAPSFRLDLEPSLEVADVTLDGEPVDFVQRGKDLVVAAAVVVDDRHQVEIGYAGTPQPVDAPTSRADVSALGWTTMPDGSTWTMQEPFGGYTWYAVNDQPSDKALYDFTLRVPRPMVGVANGELMSRRTQDGIAVTRWHLAEPAASYLVTVAFDDYATSQRRSPSGVPVSIWLPREEADRRAAVLDTAIESLTWSEGRLGRFPFDALGFLFVQSTSGMETQTMVTLGMTDYTFSAPVLVHEVVHQWWGDQVTPRDWRDLWMSEGMTMYLQALWESEHGGTPLDDRIAAWAVDGQQLRDEAGPPADYVAGEFASANVYYLPAVMWHAVRAEIGDRTFFRLVRQWPQRHDNESAGYRDLTRWWSTHSGTDLRRLFDAHLRGEQQPEA